MTYSNKSFKGKLANSSIYDFSNQLDYSKITQEERLGFLQILLEGGNGSPHPYFLEYFDQEVNDQKKEAYFKVNLDKTDYLSQDTNVCRQLEKMADYLLFASDAKPLVKKADYKFYGDVEFKRKMFREQSLEEISSKMSAATGAECSNDLIGEVIDYLMTEKHNYKLSNKQKIVPEDLENEELQPIREYEDFINCLKEKIKKIEEEGGDKKLIYLLRKHMTLCRQDQIILKDSIKGTIYFKYIHENCGEVDYLTHFNFSDAKHVRALLKYGPKKMPQSDLGHILFDLEQLLAHVKLSKRDKEILRHWREKDSTEKIIANALGMQQPNVSRTLTSIASRVVKIYQEKHTEWLYLNCRKGTYKTCTKCGKTKLIQMFNKQKTGKYGVNSVCKTCRTK
ncbi:hypothetical protein [Vallitalea okinawensis]|uniref:hypothetical protein n=1 Tax=Vallitalea okinawensis TaxID=2078660 RepID=UPI000CFC8BCD|nr:hypothetical protein [Vallitalea okinawensis]